MIAKNIKYYRERDGYTQDELSKLLQVAKNTVSAWERGLRLPEKKHIEALSNQFCVTEYELFCRIDASDTLSKAIDRLYRLPEPSQMRIIACVSEEWSKYGKD